MKRSNAVYAGSIRVRFTGDWSVLNIPAFSAFRFRLYKYNLEMPTNTSVMTPSSSFNAVRLSLTSSSLSPNACALINSLACRISILVTCDILAQTIDIQQDKLVIARLGKRDPILYNTRAKMNLIKSPSKIMGDMVQYNEPRSWHIPTPYQDASEIPLVLLKGMCLDELSIRPTLALNISLAVQLMQLSNMGSRFSRQDEQY